MCVGVIGASLQFNELQSKYQKIPNQKSEGREPEVCKRERFREEQGVVGVRSWVANVLGCVSFFSCMSGLILRSSDITHPRMQEHFAA